MLRRVLLFVIDTIKLHLNHLARSTNMPTWLYILLALISFVSFVFFLSFLMNARRTIISGSTGLRRAVPCRMRCETTLSECMCTSCDVRMHNAAGFSDKRAKKRASSAAGVGWLSLINTRIVSRTSDRKQRCSAPVVEARRGAARRAARRGARRGVARSLEARANPSIDSASPYPAGPVGRSTLRL